MPQLTEQDFKLGLRRQKARRGWVAHLCAFRIDEACAGNVSGAVARATGQIDKNQFWRVKAGQQVAGLDDQRQAREVRHLVLQIRKKRQIVAYASGFAGAKAA